MTTGDSLSRTCPFCTDGQMEIVSGDPPGSNTIPCPHCGATSLLEWGKISEPYIRTYKIVENTDSTEYNALSDANKDAYNMIISCGVADITDGTSIRTKLWNMFDDQSTTRVNLIALLGE